MKRKNSFVPFGIATAALVALAAGAMLYQYAHPGGGSQVVTQERPFSAPEPILPEPLPSPATPHQDGIGALKHIYIFKVVSDDNGSHLKRVDSPGISSSSSTATEDATEALNAMANETDSPLPAGTQVHQITFRDPPGVADVDFNQAFVDNFKGGDEAEALTINAVLATIGQFGQHSVQITVAGKKIDSLGGNLSLTNPVPVPQASEQTAQGSSGKP